MIDAVLSGLARANLAAAAAILLVLLVRKPARRFFGARTAYGFWLIPVLAAGAALAPHPAGAPPMMAPMVIAATTAAAQAMPIAQDPGLSVLPALFAAWIAGLTIAALLLWRRQASFIASLGRLQPFTDGVLRAERDGVGPAVVGAVFPRIVTPADFETRFDAAERDVILAHEQIHLAVGDARINALAAALQCLCWFNPMVHIGVRLLRIDQELACDAAVLRRFPAARKLYAAVLLKTQLAAQPLPLGCHWPAAGDHPLKERIVMLKSPLPAPSRSAFGVAAVASLSLAGAAAAWATQPGPAATGLEPAEAMKLLGPNDSYMCPPDAKHELHNCHVVHGSYWSKIPTAADIQRLYPPEAHKAGVTARVLLKCAPNFKTLRFEECSAVKVYPIGNKAISTGMAAAFEAAAIRVEAIYRLSPKPPAGEHPMPNPAYGTIDFSPSPVIAGGKPVLVTHAPDALPIPAKVSETAHFYPVAVQAAPTLAPSPNWSRRPVSEDVMRVYPGEALRAGLSGAAVLHCQVKATGDLSDCAVLSETPAGAGFGAAALKLAPLFEARAQTPEGGPKRGGEIRIPIRFMPPQAPAQASGSPVEPPSKDKVAAKATPIDITSNRLAKEPSLHAYRYSGDVQVLGVTAASLRGRPLLIDGRLASSTDLASLATARFDSLEVIFDDEMKSPIRLEAKTEADATR
jgi:TonB family protein